MSKRAYAFKFACPLCDEKGALYTHQKVPPPRMYCRNCHLQNDVQVELKIVSIEVDA